ncbi:MAG: chemotaxis protein CheW [Proteobacteria bacterium]|nr:chemotaxis protein CheW [Pseudomonadota bacterium]
MSMNPWGGESNDDKVGLFTIRKSLDGEQTVEYVDKEQFIGVKIGKEEFLLSIDYVNEIIILPVVTYIPNSPKFVEGVINLRGTILPVINIRKMMGLSKAVVTSTTRVIVCRDESINFKVGLLVDAITFVVALLPAEIVQQSLPSGTSDTELITRISKSGSVVKGIVDLAKILHTAAEGRSLSGDDSFG